jgi:hypothetical protein
VQVFLCYATEDKAIAEPIAFSLRARGYKVFIDRDDLPPAGEYDMRIERAVERANLVVFLVSPASVAKGRFTLTELEFARRKWRTPDGHVMPVMVEPTPLRDIPSFLKSVTILEPKGNVAAEVASAVGSIAQRSIHGNMIIFGGLGAISGLIWVALRSAINTTTLMELIDEPLEHDLLEFNIIESSIKGTLFAAALIGGFAYVFRFHFRHIAILAFVIAGFLLASQASYSKLRLFPDLYADLDSGIADRSCLPPGRTVAIEDCVKVRERWKEAIQKNLQFREFWTIAGLTTIASALQALILILGILIATGRELSFSSGFAITLAGTIVTVVVYFLFDYIPGERGPEYILAVSWQASVAAFIGRSIR